MGNLFTLPPLACTESTPNGSASLTGTDQIAHPYQEPTTGDCMGSE